MTLANKNWTLNTYTAATWTDLIAADEAIIASLIIANPTAGDAVVQIRLTDNTPTSRATILPEKVISASTAEVLDMRSLYIGPSDRVQISVDVVGVEFTVSGVEVV